MCDVILWDEIWHEILDIDLSEWTGAPGSLRSLTNTRMQAPTFTCCVVTHEKQARPLLAFGSRTPGGWIVLYFLREAFTSQLNESVSTGLRPLAYTYTPYTTRTQTTPLSYTTPLNENELIPRMWCMISCLWVSLCMLDHGILWTINCTIQVNTILIHKALCPSLSLLNLPFAPPTRPLAALPYNTLRFI